MILEPNDPTRSGSPLPPGAARLSRNEVEALCLKAARGAGMAWGLAEEAAFSAGWLSSRGIDGPAALAAHLDWLDDRGLHEVCPEIGPDRWASAATVSPIVLGAALSDFAALLGAEVMRAGSELEVHRPILLLPFLAQVSQTLDRPLRLACGGAAVTVAVCGALDGDAEGLADVPQGATTLAVVPVPPAAEVRRERPTASGEALARLHAFAMRTTVPASAESRAGAGAAAGDND